VAPGVTNMLSKIIEANKINKSELKNFSSPSLEELDLMIADKRREAQRMKIIDENQDDPVKAAKREANRILIEAQDKLKEAGVEAELIKTRKEKEIRMQLEKEYQLKFEQKVDQIQKNYLKSEEELARLKQILYKQSEKQLMDLVFSISRKVIDSEIKTNPDIVLNMLKKGFEKIKDAKEYEIKINPLDFEALSKRKDELGEIVKTSGVIKFTKDEHIERGGCQIVTELGEISSEPGKQLDIIIRELSNGA
jgi:flagellar assembly protein FliH